ncbi:YoaK family protein [Sphingomonas oryzagri]|jgi:uncharacterized membrane protein YoaK (UPF0700 family)|uniref:YoaK family protein n=1 Tax=Sphingomonas oryzagri TaxID=3042314 RepID=A0ABT6N0C3_9SPHN|nr:YoaK family protein [Sphingomonas oryzagri]MDH7638516.1 YoaK family protein [Sphingomonas oryzagri]
MQSLPTERTTAAILLALVAGCVDAVGFTELGGYFVSFMSGNSTRLGMHLAYREWHSALFVGGLIVLFIGGAALGALIDEVAGRFAASLLFLVEAALIGVAGLMIEGAHPITGIVLLPVAMGLSNALVLGERGARIGMTYMTGTLVRIGTGLTRLGRPGEARAVMLDCLLWGALVLGVALGARGQLRYGPEVLFAPAAALVLLSIVEAWFSRRRTA